jgi:predicted AAA+ superfamily ATPase
VPNTIGLNHHLPQRDQARIIDLLKTDTFVQYASRPALLRESWDGRLTVIDEIQKIPPLLDEVHWLIENRNAQFLLTGSSARKLRRGHANLLGGRAWRFEMGPLSVREVEGFDLESSMTSGMIPLHYLSPDPEMDLRAYVTDYLKEEIAAEALTQDLPAFSDFLRVAALTSSELINYTNVARECGVNGKVVRTYFQILEDTMLGFRLKPWITSKNRRMISTEKFYLFDVGVANFLAKRKPKMGSAEFGKSFEHFILMEVENYRKYKEPDLEVSYWRTSTGLEVDLILGEMTTAVECKGSARVHEGDLRHLAALKKEHTPKNTLIVSLESEPRHLAGGIESIPWQHFLDRLWEGTLTV